VLSKCVKFGAKVFLYHIGIAVFMLQHFYDTGSLLFDLT